MAAALALAAAPAWAKKRVVVLGFAGPQAGKAESAVQSIVSRKHTVVSAAKYTKARKRLRVRGSSNRDVARVAGELQVDAVVSGSIRRKGARWSITVSVREGKTGKSLDSVTVPLRSPRLDERAKGALSGKLLAAINRARPVGGGDDDGEADDAAVAKGKGKGKGKGKPPEPPPDEYDDDDEDPLAEGDEGGDEGGGEGGEGGEEDSLSLASAGQGGSGDEEASAASTSKVTWTKAAGQEGGLRAPGVDVAIGMSLIGRYMGFTYDSRVSVQPWGYDGNPVPGIYLNGEVYPLALIGTTGPLAGIGLSAVFDRVLVLKSTLENGGPEYTTTQMRYGVGVRYRWNIGDKVTWPTVKFGLGFSGLTFSIATPATTYNDLPNVTYATVDAGAGVKVPLASPKLAFLLDARYLMVLSTGEMETTENYGSGSVAGMDLDAGLEFRPLPRYAVRVGGRYTRIAYDFDGTGTKTWNRDGDTDAATADQDVGGALDKYFGGYLMGVVFF